MGTDASLLGTLPYSVPTERENALSALAIDRTADLPIILSNYPDCMSVEMGRKLLNRVGRSKNAISTRKARVISTASTYWRAIIRISNYPAVWTIRRGHSLPGARAAICAGSNFLREEHVYLYQTCAMEGDFAKGRCIISAMMPLMRVLEQVGKFIQCGKHDVEVAGLSAGPIRPPLNG